MSPLKWFAIFGATFLFFGAYGLAALGVGLYIQHRLETR